MATTTAPLASAQTAPQTSQPAIRTRRPNNAVWFEIPVRDLDRSMWFYETVFRLSAEGGCAVSWIGDLSARE